MQPGINSSSASSIFHAVFLEDYHFFPSLYWGLLRTKEQITHQSVNCLFFFLLWLFFFLSWSSVSLESINMEHWQAFLSSGRLSDFFLLWAADFNLINFPHRLFAVLSVHQKWSFYFRASWASRWLIPPEERSCIFIITALWKAFS